MNAVIAGDPTEGPPLAADEARMPRRPRRRWLTPLSAVLLATLTAAAGFYVGVRIERGRASGGSSAAGSGASGAPAGGFAAFRRSAGAAAGGAPGGALPGAGGGTSLGTISGVSGRTLYVNTGSGNTVKVQISAATRVTKSVGVRRSSLRPGDTVVVRGVTNSHGAVAAATVSDSGASGSGTTSTGTTGSSASSGSSAVGSLFSGRG